MASRAKIWQTGLACAAIASCALAVHAAESPQGVPGIPTFAQLEAAGAVIGEIRIAPRNIFNLDDPREDYSLYGLVNRLHVTTRPIVIEQALLFRRGERVSVRLIEETERILRANRYLYDARIDAVAWHDGLVDIEVTTRDTWTIDIAGKASRSGGSNSTSFGVTEYNLLGTGVRVGVQRTADADRNGTQFDVGYDQAFDGWTRIAYDRGRFNDGKSQLASIVRPFYSLDARWTAGGAWTLFNRLDSIYDAGDVASQYRHRARAGEVFAGWSPGLIDGWTQRFTAGATGEDHDYALEPGVTAPLQLPGDHAFRTLYFRHEVIEDRYVRLVNRNLIGRPEFFLLGFSSLAQVARETGTSGTAESAWLYFIALNKGIEFAGDQDFLGTLSVERRVASTGAPMTQAGAAVRYYAPQGGHFLFYAALSGDRIQGGGQADQLLLGGDNGLRGYPLRYQSGERRALVTLEQRGYTDWYPFALFRVGGVAFVDAGRATGGPFASSTAGRWLSDVGVGLRIAIDRAARANVLHLDLAMPLNRQDGIKGLQFLVKTQIGF
jgi:hypothetical protein